MSQENDRYTAEGLDELLHRDYAAQRYFESLPKDIQDKVMQRRRHIRTEDALQRCVDNLAQEDE